MLRAMLIAAALSWLAAPALAQAPRPVTTYKAPRAADGRPDLQGVWTNASLTRLERAPATASGWSSPNRRPPRSRGATTP